MAQLSKATKKEFVASNSLTGCTQKFDYDISPFTQFGLVQLIDSPGLSDPNLPIDQWVNLYNKTIAQQQWQLDLVVCVIEFCERPSTKEFSLFALLNQALSAIKAENLVILFNKVPEDIETEDARNFYNQCIKNLNSQYCKLPQLTDTNFLVLTRKSGVKKSLSGSELQAAQQKLNELLTEEICPFFQESLSKVKLKIKPQEADRRKIAESFLDESSKKEMADQLKLYEAQKRQFEQQIQQQKQQFDSYKTQMDQQARVQELAMQSLQLEISSQAKSHDHAMELMKTNFNDEQNKTAEAHSQQIAQMQADMNHRIQQIQAQQKASGGGRRRPCSIF